MSALEPSTAATAIPQEARAHQGRPAGVVSRSVAAGLDFGVLVCLLLGAYGSWALARFVWDPQAFSFPEPSRLLVGEAYLVFGVGYLALCWWMTGRSVGQLVLGLRVLSASGRRLGPLRALARGALCVLFPAGLLWVAISPSNNAIHDLLLRSRVTYDWTVTR